MLSKAQEWAAGEQAREARRQELRTEMMNLKVSAGAPSFTLKSTSRKASEAYATQETIAAIVTSDGGCELQCGYGTTPLTADEACGLARWILETFT